METFVGSCNLQVIDEPKNLLVPTWVMYPTCAPPVPAVFGPYSVRVSLDALIDQGQFPLVVISHGSGGSPLVYRTIGAFLAKRGYIVALPEHPGNNRNNNALYGTVENLVNRPRHIRLVIDAISSSEQFKDRMQQNHVGVIGHSMGGYTALAVAGGIPRSETWQKVEVVTDKRVKALALMAPATGWYLAEDSLKDVVVPILIFSAEHDPFTPPQWHAQLVLDRVPDRTQIIHRVVENAGHFSFLSPFPPAMKKLGFMPSMDPEGFDREKFHEKLNADLLTFFDRTLKDS